VSTTVQFAHYTRNDGSRVLAIGPDVREELPVGVHHQDSGDYRPWFAIDCVRRWMASHQGHTIEVRFEFAGLDKDKTKQNFKKTGVIGACMWPSMSSGNVVTCHIYVDGVEQPWGTLEEVFRIELSAGMKLFKRMNEIIRMSRFWYRGKVNMLVLDDVDIVEAGYTPHMFDGCSILSRSFVLKAIKNAWNRSERRKFTKHVRSGKLVRLSAVRGLFKKYMLKGDGVVIDDDVIFERWGKHYDIITSEQNLKKEIRLHAPQSDDEDPSPNEDFVTFEPKKALGEVFHDFQTKSWMRDFLDTSRQCKTLLTHNLNEVLASLAAGELPDWTMFNVDHYLHGRPTIDSHGEPRPAHVSEVMARNWYWIGASGLDIRCSATLTSLISQGVILAMQSRLYGQDFVDEQRQRRGQEQGLEGSGERRNPNLPVKQSKMWTPAPWSVRGYVISREILEHMTGRTDIPGDQHTIAFDAQTGSVVIPGRLWEAYKDLHGGGDYDDGLCIMLRKVPKVKVAKLKTLRRFIPAVKDEGIVALQPGETIAVCYRQPNTNGEYFAMRIDEESFADHWFNTGIEMPELNVDATPIPADMRPSIDDSDIPEDVWNTAAPEDGGRPAEPGYTVHDAKEAIQVAFLNPGVGAFMNALMLANDMGIDLNLPITAEWVVDTCQASPYRQAMGFLEAQVKAVKDQVLAAAREGQELDKLLKATKVAPKDKQYFPDRTGFFYATWRWAVAELLRFKKEAREIGFQLRAEHPIPGVMDTHFSDDVYKIAEQAVRYYMKRKGALQYLAEQARRNKTGEESPYRVESGRMARTIVKKCEKNGMGRAGVHQILLCMYQIICTPAGRDKWGIGDNMIFGPPPENEEGMLDRMMEALATAGITKKVGLMYSSLLGGVYLEDRLGRRIGTGSPNINDVLDALDIIGGLEVFDDHGNRQRIELDPERQTTVDREICSLYIGTDAPKTMREVLHILTGSADDYVAENAVRALGIAEHVSANRNTEREEDSSQG
jgi:hypothetical protein